MDQIRISQLRSLIDTGYIAVRPVTLLVGRNSSGKSTFLRFFPLLRQSVETRTTGPVLWYGNLVDFGDFDDAVWADAQEREVTFGFKFLVSAQDEYVARAVRWPRSRFPLIAPVDLTASLRLAQDPRDGATRCSGITLELAGHRVDIEFGMDGTVEQFLVNSYNVLSTNSQFTQINRGGLIPSVMETPRSQPGQEELDPYRGITGHGAIGSAFVSAMRPLFHGNTKASTIRSLLLHLGIGTDQQMLEQVRSFREGGDYWKKRAAGLRIGSSRFSRIRDLVIAKSVPDLLYVADSYLSRCAANIRYIGPFRATAERYYRTQALAVEEVDYEGRNLAMFLRSLTDTERRNFQDWTGKHFGLSVTTRLGGGHLSLRVTDLRTGTEFNLADTGFGLSQVLPVLAQLWSMIFRSRRRAARRQTPLILAVEQPELHLHPSMQARLADVFLSSVLAAREHGIDLRLVIETHSESIINRVGNRIFAEKIAEDIASVVIFEGGGGEGSALHLSSYDADGFLTEWPLGFFEPEPIQEEEHVTADTADTYAD